MTQLLTAAQMRAIEMSAIESGAVSGLDLMERAGRGVVEEICKWRPDLAEGTHRASILCGPGNNGGDGYVVARLLSERGWDVDVHALTPPRTPDAQAMAEKWGGETLQLTEACFRFERPPADLYVDAIFGTGLTRAPEGELLSFFRHLGGSGGDFAHYLPRMVAIDAPSGLCLDSGRMLAGGVANNGLQTVPLAGLTVTFECPKVGHFVGDGPALCGQLTVVDLGLSKWRGVEGPDAMGQGTLRPARIQLLDRKAWAAPCANDRFQRLHFSKLQGHKFTHGHCLVVAGGFGRTGAARLAARSALRMGTGLVTVAAPSEAMAECATQLTAIMLREAEKAEDLSLLLADPRVASVCIGPGLGLTEADAAKVAAVLESGKATVLDADALTLVARDTALREKIHKNCVLTPHAGEFRRLWPDLADALLHPMEIGNRAQQRVDEQEGLTLSGPATSKVDVTLEAGKRAGATVLFKGIDTVIADPGGFAFVHAAVYGREAPWLATAGAGDVLAGLIAGRLAQGFPATSSAASMAWLHVEAARVFGPGLIAEDLPDMIPAVLRRETT